MKSSPLTRKTGLKRKRSRHRRPADDLLAQMARFKESVYYQRCAACGCRHPMSATGMALAPGERWGYHHAHHVVYQQHVPVEQRWDVRNALPVCMDCHERHHNASRRIPLSALTEQNLEFAHEVLGDAADYYLERHYSVAA